MLYDSELRLLEGCALREKESGTMPLIGLVDTSMRPANGGRRHEVGSNAPVGAMMADRTTQAATRRFDPGESILSRGIDEHQRVISVTPVRVVRDDADLVALWLPLGTPTIKPELVHHEAGAPRRWVDGNWHLTESTWRWAEVLKLVRPNEGWSTWVRWSANREFQGWAINMQAELVRTQLGFDVWDHQLDILVKPDRSWHWKDRDELELSVELGRMTRDQAAAVEAEAKRAVTLVEGNGFPYSDGWEAWQPDPTWQLPHLQSEWADVSMHRHA